MCLTVMAGTAGAQATTSTPLDSASIAALRRMGAYLRSLDRFTVDAQTMLDDVLSDGETATLAGTVSYTVHLPNRLRADIRTDRKQRQIFYDGKTFTVFAPRMHYYASVPAPSTISAMLDTARKRFEIDFPLADLFLWGTARDGLKDLTSARYIGPAYVDGVDTDQFAFREKDVDWQLWIQRGNTPLPKRIVITTKNIKAQPRYVATLKWNTAPPITDAVFGFTPPAGTTRIVFASTMPVMPTLRATK